MKHKLYRNAIILFAFGIIGTAFGQKFDKKYSENFKTNKDVEVVINASNTEINVTTWNKNEVQIDAFIEVEGISKEEAEKYFKNWNFEALGNSKTVKITAKGGTIQNFEGDFVFFGDKNFNFPDITIPDIDIDIPDVDFDFYSLFETLDTIEEDMIKNSNYSFEYDDGEDHIIIKSKDDWEKFKKSKKYDAFKKKMEENAKQMKINGEKLKIEISKSKEKLTQINRQKIKEEIQKAKVEFQKIDKEKLKEELAKVSEEMKKMKFSFSSEGDNMFIGGKKVKIKKRLEIKVPKAATFNLNTRHCKVKLPNTVAFGKVKYGAFTAQNLHGGKLNINYSPVTINDLNACTLFLNNVTDAKIASVTNTNLSTNYSGVHIKKINENVNLNHTFGELTIEQFSPDFNSFTLHLNYAEAYLNLSAIKDNFSYTIGDKSPFFSQKPSLIMDLKNTDIKNLNGNFTIKSVNSKFVINGEYSQLKIKK